MRTKSIQTDLVLRPFRERVRADPELLRAYVARKRSIISSGTTDSVGYAEAKGSFIEETLKTTEVFRYTALTSSEG